jgi:hypothetical protein
MMNFDEKEEQVKKRIKDFFNVLAKDSAHSGGANRAFAFEHLSAPFVLDFLAVLDFNFFLALNAICFH